MTIQGIDDVLSRWFLDEQFREKLRRDSEQVLAGYDLTPEQRARLLKLQKHPVQTRPAITNYFAANTKQPFSLN